MPTILENDWFGNWSYLSNKTIQAGRNSS